MKRILTPSMELDLDSLLNSTLDSDLDSPSTSVPHRTLDEILNSSDSSPSPPNSPPSSRQFNPHISRLDVSSLHVEIESLDSSMESLKLGRFLSSAASLEPPPRKQSSLPSSRQLSLFAEMKMSAKPGAALAAATAASRSVPSPHAKAIKLRRAAATHQSPSDEQENETLSFVSTSVIGDSEEGDSKMRSNGVDMPVNGEALVQSEGTEDILSDVDFKAISSDTMVNSSSDALSVERTEEHSMNLDVDVKMNDPNIGTDDLVDLDVNNVHFPEQDLDTKNHPSEDPKEFESHVSSGSSVKSGEEHTDDESSIDVSELVEEKIELLESERNLKNGQQKRKYLKPLDFAEEQEKKRAFTGLNWVEGAASQPMRLEGVRRGSTSLGYFDIQSINLITKKLSSNDFQRDCGSAHVVAVNFNCVVVGTFRGFVVVFPCRYNPHYADNSDLSQVKIFGQQGDRSSAAVTSMSFNHTGDLLLVGYSNGNVTMLDFQKEASVKVVTGEQNLPVVHASFLGQDLQVSRQFKAITGNSKSMFFLHSFSLIPVINRLNIKTLRFLDTQQMGIVMSVSPLIFEEYGGSTTPSQSNTFVPSSGSIGSMVGGVVSGEAGWKLFNDSSSIVEESVAVFVSHQNGVEVRLIPSSMVLARLPKPDGVRDGSIPYTAWKSEPQTQNTYSETIPGDSAEKVSWLAIAWDRKVQVAKFVKSDLKICAKWSVDSTAIGVVWLDIHMLVVITATGQLYLYAKNGTAIHQTSFSIENFGGNDLVAYHTHFLNVFGNPEKAYHNAVAVRGASVYILGPTHIIVARLLPWKERVQVLRQAGDWMGALSMAMTLYDGQTHGVTDLPKSISAAQDIIMPYLAELILSYVEEVFSYISVAFSNQLGKAANAAVTSTEESNVHSEIKEQFTRVGGVSVEFCVHIHRPDILFDDIYAKFLGVQHKETFLELLEPYILRDMLGSLPPEIMQALVEHYNNKGWLQRVEQCILHMNISSLDFNQVVRLCRENGLYMALIYLFNKGLDDYRAPLEELLEVSRNEQQETASALGYRMLVYLKYCFCGLAFPPGHGTISPSRCPSIRKELVQFLLEKTDGRNLLNHPQIEKYIVLHHFLLLDAEATLYVLRCAFADCLTSNNDDVSFAENEATNEKTEEESKMLQNVIDSLVNIIEATTKETNETNKEEWPTTKELGHLFEFISLFIAYRKASVSPSVLNKIFEFLASEVPTDAILKKEKQVLALLNQVPESYWHSSYLLSLCEKASFHQVCGMIYKKRRKYYDALDCFMRDENEPITAFVYIDNTIKLLNNDEAFRTNVIGKIPHLVTLNRECTFFMIISHFPSETSSIIAKLQPQPSSLFLYLKTSLEVYLSGTLDFSHLLNSNSDDPFAKSLQEQNQEIRQYIEKLSEFPKLVQSHPVTVSDGMIELYLELLCKYERNSVLKFLQTFDSYRVEHCLRLCQEYEIIDAAAFLLERVGDVGTALSLTLSSLDEKFEALDGAAGISSGKKRASEFFNRALNSKEARDIEEILQACVVLCQRNTPRLVSEESEALWFRVLDSFCGPLVNKSGAMRKVCAHFVKQIVEGMVGYVRLPTIMSKVLSDNGRQEFGDFKTTILGMLGTYGFERRILDTAKALIEDDTFYTMSLLKKAVSHGYAPRSLTCCLCNSSFSFSSSPSLRLFSCGHSTHLHCQTDSRASLSSCPLCLPKLNSKSRPKSDFALVHLASSPVTSVRSLHAPLDPHETTGSNHLSRFDLLLSLGKDQRVAQVEAVPVLKLAPPAVYHERTKKLHRPLVPEVEPEPGPTRWLPRKSTIFGKQVSVQR